jgi:hypothetical protein
MTRKIVRPALALSQGRRAENGHPGGISSSDTSKLAGVSPAPGGDSPGICGANVVPIVRVHSFASYRGAGLQVPVCPFCGFEHYHGPFILTDFRENTANWGGWRRSACNQAPREHQPDARGLYKFILADTPARIVPGQGHNREALIFLEGLAEAGFAICATEPLPSRCSPRWWWKRTGGPGPSRGGRP